MTGQELWRKNMNLYEGINVRSVRRFVPKFRGTEVQIHLGSDVVVCLDTEMSSNVSPSSRRHSRLTIINTGGSTGLLDT